MKKGSRVNLGKRKRTTGNVRRSRRFKLNEDSDTSVSSRVLEKTVEEEITFEDNLELLKGFGTDFPTYCYCNSVYYDNMIGCDGKGCEIEWFHFVCVSLKDKPEGRWFCPDCI